MYSATQHVSIMSLYLSVTVSPRKHSGPGSFGFSLTDTRKRFCLCSIGCRTMSNDDHLVKTPYTGLQAFPLL